MNCCPYVAVAAILSIVWIVLRGILYFHRQDSTPG